MSHGYVRLFEENLTEEQRRLAEIWLDQKRSTQWIANQFGCERRYVSSFKTYLNKLDVEEPALKPGNEDEFAALMASQTFQNLNIKPGFQAKIPGYATVTNSISLAPASGNYYIRSRVMTAKTYDDFGRRKLGPEGPRGAC